MEETLFYVLQIVVALVLFGVVYFFARPIFWGAPYAPSDEGKILRMLTFAKIKKGDKAVDIGSGDGRIVIALAQKGAEAIGYEINPILCLIANIRLRRMGRVYRKNFWKADFSKFDVVVIFGITYIMPALEKKLLQELRPGARVVSNYFAFPTWKPTKVEGGVYVYEKK